MIDGNSALHRNFNSDLNGRNHVVAHSFASRPSHQHGTENRLLSGKSADYPDKTGSPLEGSREEPSAWNPVLFNDPESRQSHLLLTLLSGVAHDFSQGFWREKFREDSEEVLQRWEGIVETVDRNEGVFSAKLYDDLETDEAPPSDVAELLIDNVSDDDQSLLQPGAVFYLIVGYLLRPGRKDGFVRIKFRRLPKWTESDLLLARERAQEITRFFDSEN